ncbi:hypothetical protein [Trinickia sp.]|uniref:hypothetical protein n=1 Tax=Trinickia sp. TaxID=2571163 RepID=UPI003F7EE3B1
MNALSDAPGVPNMTERQTVQPRSNQPSSTLVLQSGTPLSKRLGLPQGYRHKEHCILKTTIEQEVYGSEQQAAC